MRLIKQILGSLVAATVVTVACQFIPVINALVSDYLLGVFLAAIVVPIIVRKYVAYETRTSCFPEAELQRRKKECEDWHKENSDAMNCPSYCYDQRNVDSQLHVFDGFKNDRD